LYHVRFLMSYSNHFKKEKMPYSWVHAYNSRTQEAKTGEFQVQDQPGLHSKILFQNKTKQKHNLLISSYGLTYRYIAIEIEC
jgi:hypothetical protein